jgi:lipopolysaccharide transport system ATP-binding protein
VLFVSHNLTAVRALCPHSILLDCGRVQAAGLSSAILELYSQSGLDSATVRWTRPAPSEGAPQEPAIRVTSVKLLEPKTASITVAQPLRIALEFIVEGQPSNVIPGLHFFNSEGLVLFSSADWSLDRLEPGSYSSVCEVPAFLLNEGRIVISAFLFKSDKPSAIEVPVDWIAHTISFDIDASPWGEKTQNRWLRPWPGIVRPDLRWAISEHTQGG